MKNFNAINQHSSVSLTRIYEPYDNSLILEVKKSMADEIQHDGKLGLLFTISFGRYVSYHVINESYARPSSSEIYVAGDFCTFCIFPNSRYMDHILQETFAEEIYPSELRHYTLFAANHVVHIISRQEPVILMHSA